VFTWCAQENWGKLLKMGKLKYMIDKGVGSWKAVYIDKESFG